MTKKLQFSDVFLNLLECQILSEISRKKIILIGGRRYPSGDNGHRNKVFCSLVTVYFIYKTLDEELQSRWKNGSLRIVKANTRHSQYQLIKALPQILVFVVMILKYSNIILKHSSTVQVKWNNSWKNDFAEVS